MRTSLQSAERPRWKCPDELGFFAIPLIDCLKQVGKFICGEIAYCAVVALRSGVHTASLCVQQYLIFECVCINSVNDHVLSLP